MFKLKFIGKLPVVITKSPYFKPAKAEDVFGREPVERCLSLVSLFFRRLCVFCLVVLVSFNSVPE